MNTKIAEKVFRVLIVFAFLSGTTWMPRTTAGAQELIPTFSANLTENTISDLWEWHDGALLTLTIDHPDTPQSPDYTDAKIYDPVNGTRFELEDFTLQIGDLVTVTDGITTKSTIVANVSITEVNVENETISGTADPLTNVRVNVWAAGLSRLVQTDANGNWLADFSEEYDIHAGDNGRVTIEDSDGDRTGEYYHVNYTLTRIEAYPDIDRIGGGQWPLGTTVTIEIDDPATQQNPDYIDSVMVSMTEDPYQTWFDMDISGYDLKTGDVITATDGTTIKQLIVSNLMITDVDLDADMVYGVAEPNQTGHAWIGVFGGYRYVTADQDGNWSANFAVPGDWDGEWVIADLRPGSLIEPSFYDADCDATVLYGWSVPTNQPPQITSISAPMDPVQVGAVVEVTATFFDPDLGDTHTATWDWGDNSTSAGTVGGDSISGSHVYETPGVYTVTLTVQDNDGGTDTATFQYVVIYDPEGGFVIGGGWIWSPKGAYVPDGDLEGKATFGFVSKYKKGASVPTGNTEFQFQVADLNFKSISYDWLVIAGSKAKYKGTGTINGMGEYGFMLSAIDGMPDMFHIKIWDKETDTLVYDNQLDATDDTDPVTALGGGSIVIHKAK